MPAESSRSLTTALTITTPEEPQTTPNEDEENPSSTERHQATRAVTPHPESCASANSATLAQLISCRLPAELEACNVGCRCHARVRRRQTRVL